MAVIRWGEPRDQVDKNRTRCHILCDHCHKTWHIRDMWQGVDNVSRRWLSGKMIAKQDLNFVYNQLKGWDSSLELGHKSQQRVSLCHNKTPLCPGLREGARCPSSDLGPRDHGVLATYSAKSLDVSSSRAKWCNFNLIFNGAVSLRFLKTKLLFHSHIAFTEDNYSPSAILASLIVSSGREARLELKWTG